MLLDAVWADKKVSHGKDVWTGNVAHACRWNGIWSDNGACLSWTLLADLGKVLIQEKVFYQKHAVLPGNGLKIGKNAPRFLILWWKLFYLEKVTNDWEGAPVYGWDPPYGHGILMINVVLPGKGCRLEGVGSCCLNWNDFLSGYGGLEKMP